MLLTLLSSALAGPSLQASYYGDALAPFEVQSQFRGEGTNPVARLWEGLGELFGGEALGDGLHIPFALGFVVLAVLAYRWWPLSFALFGTAVLLVALGAENLNSLERYGLNAVVLALAPAVLCRPPWAERAMIALGGAGVTALATLAWVGAYVP